MSKQNKIIIAFAVFTVFAGLIGGQSASALTLGERDANAKAKYEQARGQYLKEVESYKNLRNDLSNAKLKYQQFKNSDNKKALEGKAREFMDKAVSALVKRLETFKVWVSNRGALSEADRQEIIAEIDQDINWLKERQTKIQTATPAGIKEAAKEIREYWKGHQAKVKMIVGRIWAARIGFVIDKAESFSVKVNAKIQELKTAGRDTVQLEAWLADFNQKLSSAKEKYEAAKAKFQSISGTSDAVKIFNEGRQFIKEANQYVTQAHADLVKIVKEMKKMGQSVELPDNASVNNPAGTSME